MATINDFVKRAEKSGFVLTRFLDTTESSNLRKIKHPSLNVYFFGGLDETERVRAIILNKEEDAPTKVEYEIDIIKITPRTINRPITHRHVLGTILALGLKRDGIGDIIINDQGIFVMVDQKLSTFIKNNLTTINNVLVDAVICELDEVMIEEKKEERLINVQSLRLDATLAHALNISRTKACEMIEKGLVQVNHLECLNLSYNLKDNDLISVRHFGRIEIVNIVNTTKKNRLVVKIIIKH